MSRSVPTRATDIDRAAAEWIARRDAGLIAAEERELAGWLAADPRHAAAWARFEVIWSAADQPRALGTAAQVRRRLDERAQRRRGRRMVAGICLAACLAVVAGVSLFRYAAPGHPRVEDRIAFLGPGRVVLPDGSVAEYSAGTQLALDFGGPTRRVSFTRGEAHFEVMHDAERPFVVTAGGFAVRAVGTAFAVQVAGDSTEVLVTAGRVAVNAVSAADPAAAAPASAPLAVVEAGESVAMSRRPGNPAPVVAPLARAHAAGRLAWRERRVQFSAAPLAEVIAIVNRHNRVQFSIADADLAAVPLSGVFRLDAPDELAHLLESNFSLVIERPDVDRMVLRPRP